MTGAKGVDLPDDVVEDPSALPAAEEMRCGSYSCPKAK
jgi:hypothetical protein